jgi:branched-chain amino acid transport system permease protein
MSALASGTRTARQHAPIGALAAFVVIGVAGMLVPMVVSSQLALTLMTQAVITAVLATGIGFLIRQCGLTSFGHAAFYGLAAYIVALNGKYD